MKAVTLRDLPPSLAQRIEEEARITGASLNKTIIRLLLQATGLDTESSSGARRKRRDLSKFAGTWTKEEADEFDRYLADQRQIDPELWK